MYNALFFFYSINFNKVENISVKPCIVEPNITQRWFNIKKNFVSEKTIFLKFLEIHQYA